MLYISEDGTQHLTQHERALHNLKRRMEAIVEGKYSEFDEMMERERGDDQSRTNRFKDTWVDWETGYVRMYGPHGEEIYAIKIDTEFYRRS